MSSREGTLKKSRRLGRPPRGSEGDATLRILEAAKLIFLRDGFDGANIDAIAAAAGISKKTIYSRFTSKEDVFEAVIVRFIEENVPTIDPQALQHGSIADRLYRIALAMLEAALSSDAIAARRIIVAQASRFPEFAHLMCDYGLSRFFPLIEDCLEHGNASGDIRISDIRQAGDLFLSVTIRGFIDKAELGLERPGVSHVKREALKIYVDFFMAGCRGLK